MGVVLSHVCETAVSHEKGRRHSSVGNEAVGSILTRGHYRETSRNRQNRNSPSQNPGHNHTRDNEHQGFKGGTAIKDLAQEGTGVGQSFNTRGGEWK